mmetsp:Transcript_51653/g.116844  ORF Transcript_51653/g.116844 Transcript_51653/m.116844 type:complete len:269 (-) Transcript_51653:8-814(-)
MAVFRVLQEGLAQCVLHLRPLLRRPLLQDDLGHVSPEVVPAELDRLDQGLIEELPDRLDLGELLHQLDHYSAAVAVASYRMSMSFQFLEDETDDVFGEDLDRLLDDVVGMRRWNGLAHVVLQLADELLLGGVVVLESRLHHAAPLRLLCKGPDFALERFKSFLPLPLLLAGLRVLSFHLRVQLIFQLLSLVAQPQGVELIFRRLLGGSHSIAGQVLACVGAGAIRTLFSRLLPDHQGRATVLVSRSLRPGPLAACRVHSAVLCPGPRI